MQLELYTSMLLATMVLAIPVPTPQYYNTGGAWYQSGTYTYDTARYESLKNDIIKNGGKINPTAPKSG